MMGRRKWEDLAPRTKRQYEEVVDLQQGETMSDWWEAWMDSIQEDGSYKTDGWPGWEA